MSVAHIGKLQENTVALYKKWLRNSPGERYQHCAKWLRNSPGERYQRIRICISGEVEMPYSPIRLLNSGCKTSGCNGGGSKIPDVIHPGGMAASGWNSYPGGMSYDSHPGGMSRISYSLYSRFAYGFQRTLLNLGLLW